MNKSSDKTAGTQETTERKNLLPWLGILLFLIGLGSLSYQYHQISTWESTKATVVSVQSISSSGSSSGSNSTTYEPTLQFYDTKGHSFKVSTGYSSSQFDFKRGTQLPIAYNPLNPHQMRIITFTSYWLMPLVALALGLLLFYFSSRSSQPATAD